MTKDEALKMAIEYFEANFQGLNPINSNEQIIQACKEALEQQEIGDAEIKQMLNDIEWYQMRVKELEEELEAIAQHQILEAISNDVAKQQKDKQFYQSSLVDMVKNQQPARLVSYAPDGSTCTLNIDGEEVYFNREQLAQEPVAWISESTLKHSEEYVHESRS